MDARHEYSSSLRNLWYPRKSCPTSKRRNGKTDGAKWFSLRMVELRDAMIVLLRYVHDKMADDKTAYEKRLGLKIDGMVISFGANISCKPSSAKDRSRLHQFGAQMLTGIFMGFVLRAGEDGQVICS